MYNDRISYIIGVAINGELTNLYFGKKIHEKDDFSYVTFRMGMPNIVVDADTESYSMELNRQEYPSFGTTDFGTPAFEIETENGSRVSSFVYKSHTINKGKKGIRPYDQWYEQVEIAKADAETEPLHAQLWHLLC